MEKIELKIGGKYRHYKGKDHRLLLIGKHSETLEDMVVYESLYDNELSKIWVRPLAMFVEEIEIDGQKMPRFKYIQE